MSDQSSPLRIPVFKFLILARFCFILAMQMVNISIAWYIYELTGDKLSLGLLGLSEIIPAILLALYAGHVIDKSDKRSLLLRNMVLYMVVVIGLGLICTQAAKNSLQIIGVEVGIYLLYCATGIFRAFTGPAMASIIAQLVPKTQLARAITMSSTAWQSAAVTGPVVAGIFIAKTGIAVTFGVAVVLLAVAAVLISRIHKLEPANAKSGEPAWDSMKQGLRYVWRTRELLGAMSVDMFAVFFGGAVAMLPVFAKDILHITAEGMGWLKAAQGIGTVIILTVLSRYPIKKNQGRIMLGCVALYGVCIIAFGISTNFWLSFGVLFLSGMFDAVSMLVRSTIMQMYVPDDMRGRVSSVGSMFVNSSNELGEFESGVAARLMGTVPSVIFGGCMTIIVVAVAWIKAPMLRKLKY